MWYTREMNLPYTAGLLDGEGSIMLLGQGPKRSRRPQISIAMKDREALDAVKEVLGGFIREPRPEMFAWQLQGWPALDALEQLLPFLVIERRRDLAQLLLAGVPRDRAEKLWKMERLFRQMQARNSQRRTDIPPIVPRRATTSDERAYLAGLLDGEGHIRPNGRVEVASTDPEVLAWCASRFGGNVYLTRQGSGNHRTIWSWRRSPTGNQWAARVADSMQVERKASILRGAQQPRPVA